MLTFENFPRISWLPVLVLLAALLVSLGTHVFLVSRQAEIRELMAGEMSAALKSLAVIHGKRRPRPTPPMKNFSGEHFVWPRPHFSLSPYFTQGDGSFIVSTAGAVSFAHKSGVVPARLAEKIRGFRKHLDLSLSPVIEADSNLVAQLRLPGTTTSVIQIRRQPWILNWGNHWLPPTLLFLGLTALGLLVSRPLSRSFPQWPMWMKMAGLFVIANGIPLALLFFGGNDFQARKSRLWKHIRRQEAHDLLRRLDLDFPLAPAQAEGFVPEKPKDGQRAYLEATLTPVNRHLEGWNVLAFDRNLKHVLPVTKDQTIRRMAHIWSPFLHGVSREPAEVPVNVLWSGRTCRLYGMLGTNLDRWTLLLLIPMWPLEESLAATRWTWQLLVALNILATLLLLRAMVTRFLNPVADLTEGIRALATHRYSHRVPVGMENEWHDMVILFNQILERAEDLKVAVLVQASLFPQGAVQVGTLRAYGKSVTCGELGGDYFDYFPAGADKLLVVIGDVVGHGIPAALTMAMAKALILQKTDLWDNPEQHLRLLHEIFQANRPHGMHRFMTMQYLLIDTKTGDVIMANAGHPYPIRVDSTGCAVQILLKGLPLGGSYSPIVQSMSFKLERGDMLFLHTDGLPETKNRCGKVFGYDQVAPFVGEHWGTRPEKVWHSVYEAADKFRDGAPVEDDLTMVLVCRSSFTT